MLFRSIHDPVPVTPVIAKPLPPVPVTPVIVKPVAVPVAVKNYYSYKYGVAQTGGSIHWTNKDGSLGSAYVERGNYYDVPCMLENSGAGSGYWVKGNLCTGASVILPSPIDIIVKPAVAPVVPIAVKPAVIASTPRVIPRTSLVSMKPVPVVPVIPVTPKIVPRLVTVAPRALPFRAL